MAKLFRVIFARGLEDLVLSELDSLGIKNARLKKFVIEFEGELEHAYKTCLYSRFASRVLMPLTSGSTENEDALYQLVKAVDWQQHFDVTDSIAVDASVNSSVITNSHYAALKVKDAIVDHFMEVLQKRPNVEKQQPDIRLHLYLYKNEATLSLDFSGDALHKRGYRISSVKAPLKENLAAAILMRAGWPQVAERGGNLVDPMCGSATFLVEGAMMAAAIAPGVLRDYYGFLAWKGHDAEYWDQLKSSALDHYYKAIEEGKIPRCYGFDEDAATVESAEDNIEAIGLTDFIKIKTQSLDQASPADYMKQGLVITNPPYGERLGDVETLRFLYSDLGDILKLRFENWDASIFSCNAGLLKNIALRAHKTNKFFNGPLECQLNHYHILPLLDKDTDLTTDQLSEQAITFRNRLQKNIRHYSKWARKNEITCYRVYDADIPEYAFAIDIYDGWYHVQEYQAPAKVEIAKIKQRQREMQCVLKDVSGDDGAHIVFKTRQRQRGTSQYEKLRDSKKSSMTVIESGLKFEVNLVNYLDTGLFLDHRLVRQRVRELSHGKRVLNLFAYTGTASVYAAAGGAKSVTTVDMSKTYLEWAKRNFRLNGISGKQYEFVQDDCIEWLKNHRKKYDLVFLDPPTFSNSKRMRSSFDVQRDHLFLVKTAMTRIEKGGVLIFSNNMRGFRLDNEAIRQAGFKITDITQRTMPEDFRSKRVIHQAWEITH